MNKSGDDGVSMRQSKDEGNNKLKKKHNE